jgi:galactose mutarotase-like enzyme
MTPLYHARHHGCRIGEFVWRGHRLIVLENKRLRVGVLASKGAEIVEFRYKPLDLDVLWHAPQSVLPPGQAVPPSPRAQGPFLDYYPGGWQEVLPNSGPATTYKGAELGQHGEVALLPWDVRVVEDRAERIEVEFSVETVRTPFRLVRRMILESDSPVLHLRESLSNLGEEDMHYAWGHHPAIGAPFLEEGCEIRLPECEVFQPAELEGLQRRFATGQISAYPNLQAAAGGTQRVDQVQSKDSRTEDVLFFRNLAEGWCSLRNSNLALQFSLKWDRAIFPYFWCWQVYGGSWGYPYYGRAYTVALEPFNCPIMKLSDAVEKNLVPALAAGQTVETELEARIENV